MRKIDISKFQNLTKYDLATFIAGFSGYLFSIGYVDLSESINTILMNISMTSFIISYIILTFLVLFSIFSLFKKIEVFRINKNNNTKMFLNFIQTMFIGFYIGSLINISNQYIIVSFSSL